MKSENMSRTFLLPRFPEHEVQCCTSNITKHFLEITPQGATYVETHKKISQDLHERDTSETQNHLISLDKNLKLLGRDKLSERVFNALCKEGGKIIHKALFPAWNIRNAAVICYSYSLGDLRMLVVDFCCEHSAAAFVLPEAFQGTVEITGDLRYSDSILAENGLPPDFPFPTPRREEGKRLSEEFQKLIKKPQQ